jgi:hypothetical protein
MQEKNSADIEIFKDEQRKKYRMSTIELRGALSLENRKNKIYLFGEKLEINSGNDDHHNSQSRFKDEITALLTYCYSHLLAYGTGRSEIEENRLGMRRHDEIEAIKIKRKKIYSPENARSTAIMNIVDIGNRLKNMDQENLQLLIGYYIEKIPAKVLARERCLDMPQLGGKISAARRELRKVLGELIDTKRGNPNHNNTEKRDIREVRQNEKEIRKRKAINFIQKKIRMKNQGL